MIKTIAYPMIKASTMLLIVLSLCILTSRDSLAATKHSVNQEVSQELNTSLNHTHMAKGQQGAAPEKEDSCS